MFVLVILPFLRPKLGRWGSTDEELVRELPGDDLIKEIDGSYNHAITIDVAPADVWPWIVQLGQNKGGFYSYELLENITSCKIRNADAIVPEFQDTKVGDKVMMHPKAAPYIVVAIDPVRSFIIRLRINLENNETVDPAEPLPPKYQDGTWLFHLEETAEGKTRLVTRSRNIWSNSKMNTFFYGLFGIISVAMDRKLLKGIKKRAEKAAGAS